PTAPAPTATGPAPVTTWAPPTGSSTPSWTVRTGRSEDTRDHSAHHRRDPGGHRAPPTARVRTGPGGAGPRPVGVGGRRGRGPVSRGDLGVRRRRRRRHVCERAR